MFVDRFLQDNRAFKGASSKYVGQILPIGQLRYMRSYRKAQTDFLAKTIYISLYRGVCVYFYF